MSVGSIECFDVSPSQGQLLTIPRGNSLSLHQQRSIRDRAPVTKTMDKGHSVVAVQHSALKIELAISSLLFLRPFFSFFSSLLLLLLTVVYGFLLDIKLKLERVNVYLIGD